MAQENGLDSFSGQRANKEFWAHDKLKTEQKILKMKAHEKSLLAISEVQNKGRGKPAQTSGNSNGLAAKASAKSRHNKKQRELYKKRQKAKKVQQAKLAGSEAKVWGARTVPVKTRQ